MSIPDQSWNIVFTAANGAEPVRQPVPEPGPDQFLIRTRKSLISLGTELICYTGSFEPGTHWASWVKYPFQPGYSNAGTVVAIGETVRDFAVGDRVTTRARHQQFAVVGTPRALRIPEGVSDEDATWFGLACIVQNGVRAAQHELGDAVVVIGLGPLGQLVTQYARLSGAREVIAVDLTPGRLSLAEAHGATAVLQPGGDNVEEAVKDLTGGRMADVVYDVTGHPSSFQQALRLARTLGKVILLGDTGHPSEQHLTPDVVTRGLKIIGAHDTNPPAVATSHAYWSHPNMARLFFTYLERGQMRVSDMRTHTYSPEEAGRCYESLARDRSAAMGVLFDWTGME